MPGSLFVSYCVTWKVSFLAEWKTSTVTRQKGKELQEDNVYFWICTGNKGGQKCYFLYHISHNLCEHSAQSEVLMSVHLDGSTKRFIVTWIFFNVMFSYGTKCPSLCLWGPSIKEPVKARHSMWRISHLRCTNKRPRTYYTTCCTHCGSSSLMHSLHPHTEVLARRKGDGWTCYTVWVPQKYILQTTLLSRVAKAVCSVKMDWEEKRQQLSRLWLLLSSPQGVWKKVMLACKAAVKWGTVTPELMEKYMENWVK